MEVQLSEAEKNMPVMRRERNERNSIAWPLVVSKIMIEMLVNETLSLAVCKNLEIFVISLS